MNSIVLFLSDDDNELDDHDGTSADPSSVGGGDPASHSWPAKFTPTDKSAAEQFVDFCEEWKGFLCVVHTALTIKI